MPTDNFFSEHWIEENGDVCGHASGKGFAIFWQKGPIELVKYKPNPNGALLPDVISAVMDRINFFEDNGDRHESHDKALQYLSLALLALENKN